MVNDDCSNRDVSQNMYSDKSRIYILGEYGTKYEINDPIEFSVLNFL